MSRSLCVRVLPLVVVCLGLGAVARAAVAGQPVALHLERVGSTVPMTTPPGGSGVGLPELMPDLDAGEADIAGGTGPWPQARRSIQRGPGLGGVHANDAGRAKSQPNLVLGFDGVNGHDQRYANNGNQLSIEPPDQALCVGNGYVLESTNDVMAIYDTSGKRVLGPAALSTFYGYAAQYNRTTKAYGPSITDPSCYFDADTQRWFHVVLTLDHVGTTADAAGPNHLDIAVSQSADPTKSWTIFRLPVQNDGTQGTPNHKCDKGACIGDYPHIGADRNVFVVTTNEFALFANQFRAVEVYAISKRDLVAGALTPTVANFDLTTTDSPAPAFTLWPAASPGGQHDGSGGGTAYLMSTDAMFSDSGQSSQVWVWALGNTSAIDKAPTSLTLAASALSVQPYAIPPAVQVQKAGNTPLLNCVKDPACAPLINALPIASASPRPLAANDSRMQQVSYANGKLWAAFDTGVLLQDGSRGSGIAYVVANPHSGGVYANGTLSLPDANLSYPALGVTASGRGVIAFTLTGPNDYPSAGYASVDAKIGAGPVSIAAAGVGPWDGFTGLLGLLQFRPRWGDYGAAAVDGNSIWIATEYIAQTCSDTQYRAAPFGECGGTRAALINWATRITHFAF